MRFIIAISEPLLIPVRRLLAKGMKEKRMRFDLSPFVTMIILVMINHLLKR